MMMDSLVDLVRDVGHRLLLWRTSGGAEGAWDGTQFHAKADQWAHERICVGLSKLEPTIPVVSEEDTSFEDTNGISRYWLVDPIDGTASYAEGFAGYVTQVALMETGTPVLAVVFAPQSQHLFVAEKGGGAFCNDTRLPQGASPSLTLIDNYPHPRGTTEDLYHDFAFTRYLECGSIGLKICRVAEGTADVFVKTVQVRDWDLAAPHLILQEASGCLVDGSGADITYGAPRKHQGLVAARDHDLARHIASWIRAHVSQSGAGVPHEPGRTPTSCPQPSRGADPTPLG